MKINKTSFPNQFMKINDKQDKTHRKTLPSLRTI